MEFICKLLLVISCVIIVQGQWMNQKQLKSVVEWRTLDFLFPSQDAKQRALQNGQWVRGNGVPIDTDIDYQENLSSRIFVTIPRFTTGIPITLGYVAGAGNSIQAYPDYSWHSSHGNNCDGITSVFRVAVSISK